MAQIGPDAWVTPEQRVAINGAVRLDDPVLEFPTWARVGSELYRTDTHGRFRGSLTARGILSAEVAPTVARDLETPPSFVLLDGRAVLDVTVETGVYE
jgi:hypothetical protein